MLRAGVQDDRHLAPKSQYIVFQSCLKLDSHPPANTPYPQRQGNNGNDKNANSGTVQPSLLLRINLLLLLRLKSPCILSILCIASTILAILLACLPFLPGLLPLLRLLHLHSLPPSFGAPERFSFCCFSS